MLQCQRKHSVCDSNHSEEENVHQAAPLSQTCGWDFVDTSPALARHFTFGCLEHLTSAVLYFTRRWKMYLRNRDSYKNNVYILEEKKTNNQPEMALVIILATYRNTFSLSQISLNKWFLETNNLFSLSPHN